MDSLPISLIVSRADSVCKGCGRRHCTERGENVVFCSDRTENG